ncbi:uncharacterized protein KY384_002588 [Bacidia gigantensis]|uniref:uncharacterized protein n=1 Tax=Bacidia gigantensis TaxID=2732470 RepID=UPI001D05C048|nr:uncharacterized protein KY384_002588 [Bacidia gigantensis]KAG8532711.1 hypothetical protein KY384_002588 [Bacidia gigantensis]
MAGPLLFFVKARIPVSRSTYPRRVSFAFLKSSSFWVLEIGNILQGMGFFMPNIYLPTYARTIGLSSVDGALTVALFNTTSVFGTIIIGSLTDHFHVTSVILIATVGATASVFLFWGFSGSLPLLCIFSLIYGLFGGGYSSTWSGITQEIRKQDEKAELGVVFGLLAAGRGVGSVISGPLSEALVAGRPWSGEAALGYGSGFGPLIVFTGISMILGEKDGRLTEEIGVEFVCAVTQSLYRSRKSLRNSTFDSCLKSSKKWLRRTLESAAVRQAIGASPQQWIDINQVFYLGIPALEVQSIPSDANSASGVTTSSALMTLYYDTLMKDLERMNDLLLIARNCLATTQRAQNLAGESLLDQQVLKLIDLCVRVTARGYDGETPSRTEQPWANVIGAYKKLLITCLQFLHNFIMKNEQRKLLLWLDLFANSKVASHYTLPPGMGRERHESEGPESLVHDDKAEYVDDLRSRKPPDAVDVSKDGSPKSKRLSSSKPKKDVGTLMEEVSSDGRRAKPNVKRANISLGSGSPSDENFSTLDGDSEQELLFGAVKTERGDEFGALRTPQSAAVTLQAAKDQLMARLADQPLESEDVEPPSTLPETSNGQTNGESIALSEEEEEEDYREHEPGDQQRGLLTDIPLVLGPHEIEALPMIIQIGICPGLGSVLHGRDMQAMRCNILLAGEAGRNLLRELLIFIAAWDLQEGEIYFKLMMQIMEAILDNGLMPYAYQTFSEVKDIVSPAQSMVIKLLTQIFRGKQDETLEKAKSVKTKGKDRKEIALSNPHANASRRVDIYIVRYIFTIFRSSIIPETCALIYLQGQIKAGTALPEDFPLNLWDMERVYEGVYQFLEFFAVLTESEEWKDLLVNWEITSELITLLRELEVSIPKPPINANLMPQTLAEAQFAALQQEAQRLAGPQATSTSSTQTPVAVERPFDVNVNGGTLPATSNDGYPSLPPQSDLSEQESIESADPSDFEWRNLKKLVILVLSSLVWKSPTVQRQVRQYGGVEMVLACCSYDGNNPYIREHAIMCLRFVLEGSPENKEIATKLQRVGKVPVADLVQEAMSGVPSVRKSSQALEGRSGR